MCAPCYSLFNSTLREASARAVAVDEKKKKDGAGAVHELHRRVRGVLKVEEPDASDRNDSK